MSVPKISVIMPAYNAEKYIAEAIESILNQTYTNFEFIIINDGSTDLTEEIILSYKDKRIVYLKNDKNSGIVYTLNRGLNAAKGEYIARMDSDDISLSTRLEEQLSFMENHPEIGFCGTGIIIFGESLSEQPLLFSPSDKMLRVDMIFNCAFAHPTVIIRKSILDLYNIKYNFDFEKAEDYKMWYDILLKSKGANISKHLLKYRCHPQQITQANKNEQNASTNKIRQLQYTSLRLNTNCYLDIFKGICNGKRNFSNEEYILLRKFMKLTLKAPNNYDKRFLKKQLSGINYSVYKKSEKIQYKPLSFTESILYLKDYYLKKPKIASFKKETNP